MSKWEEHRVGEAVLQVLRAVRDKSGGHRLDVPFLTAYQIAIEISMQNPEMLNDLKISLGGAGTGVRHSFAQYLGRELSQRHVDMGIEGAFLSNRHIEVLEFFGGDSSVKSSVVGDAGTISMFRIQKTDSKVAFHP
ncbi:hypothetical protein [Humidesulfovibrio sp.]